MKIVESIVENIVETEPGVYSVILDGASHEVRALLLPDSSHEITVNGHLFEIRIADPRQWKPAGAATGAAGPVRIVSTMPGKIVRVLVAAGDDVTAGRGIVVVEAMKMQNEIKSPRDGRVTAIRVAENDSVNAGAILAVIE